MPQYRVHRLKEGPRESFRWAAHTAGLAIVKVKDYDLTEEVFARDPYNLWKIMRGEAHPLLPGDLVEEDGAKGLFITKYVGFEPAQWQEVDALKVWASGHSSVDSNI